MSVMCSVLSRQLQAHKSKRPSADAGVFSVSDGGPGRNRPRFGVSNFHLDTLSTSPYGRNRIQ